MLKRESFLTVDVEDDPIIFFFSGIVLFISVSFVFVVLEFVLLFIKPGLCPIVRLLAGATKLPENAALFRFVDFAKLGKSLATF
jgi:hypothetical protein